MSVVTSSATTPGARSSGQRMPAQARCARICHVPDRSATCALRAVQQVRTQAASQPGGGSRSRRDEPAERRSAAAPSDAVTVLLQHGDILAVNKRSDVDVSRARAAGSGGGGGGAAAAAGGRRRGETVEELAVEHLRRVGDDAADAGALTELERAFSGVVLLARTRSAAGGKAAAAARAQWLSRLEADFIAVVEGSAEEGKLQAALAAAGVPGSRVTRARVLETRPSASYGTLSLIEVTVAPGYSGGSALCRALASLGHPVVGAVLPRLAGPPSPAPRASAGQGSARRGSGEAVGAHLALIRLRFPAELEAELYAAAGPGGRHGPGGDAEGGGAAEAALLEAAVEVPKKFLKTLRREELADARRANAEARASGEMSSPRTVSFAGVDITVTNGLLVPRPSTEVMVDTVVRTLQQWRPPSVTGRGNGGANELEANPRRILDLGTGSGCILIAALARLGPESSGCGIDIDSDALAAAQRNAAAALGEASVAAVPGEAPAAAVPPRVAFLRADFSGLATGEVRRRLHPNGYHAIVSNPPYLSSAAAEGRHTEEGDRALVAGPSGMEAYEAICRAVASAAPLLLAPGGRLLLQLPGGERGLERVSKVVVEAGLAVIGCEDDLRGLPRCLVAGVRRE